MKPRITGTVFLLTMALALVACDVVAQAPPPPTPTAARLTPMPAPTAVATAVPQEPMPVFPSPTPEPTPDPQHTLEVLHREPVLVLDPGYATSPADIRITRLLFDGLVQYRGGMQDVEPALAERWERSEDGTAWTFFLRPGITFHDHSPVTADAVIFSYRRLIEEGNPYYKVGGHFSPFERLLGSEIRTIRKIDELTVRFDLQRPLGPFLFYLASHGAGIVSPTAIGKWHSDFARNPVGSGPYRLRSIETGKTVTLVPNGRFWGPQPALTAIVFRQIDDSAQGSTVLQEAQGQVLVDATADQLAQLANDPRYTALHTPGANLSWVLMNPAHAPMLADIRVRQAILHAVDVNRLVASAWGDRGTRALNPFPESMPCWNRIVRPYEYDPPLARKLLAEAGYPAGFVLPLDYAQTPRPYLPDPQAVVAAIASDLAAVSITVRLQPRPWDELTALADKRQLAFHLLGAYDLPEPDLFMRRLLVETDYARGESGLAMVELAEKAARSYDQNARCSYYQQLQQIFHDSADRILLAHAQYVDAVAKNIRGYVLDPDGVQNLRGVSLRE